MEDREYYNDTAERAAFDIGAFETLYRAFFGRVYNVVFLRLKNAADADEAVSEIFWKVYRNIRSFDRSRASFETWLLAVAFSVSTDYLRKRGRRREAEWEDRLDAAVSEEANPERRLLAKESDAELLRAMGALSETEQNVVALRFWSELSHKEIGALLGMSAGHAGVVLFRALEKLRGRLDASGRGKEAHDEA